MARGEDEVLLEFLRIGNYMKVIAIDPQTGTEVSVAGPANGSRALLTRTAINKLNYVLQRNSAKPG